MRAIASGPIALLLLAVSMAALLSACNAGLAGGSQPAEAPTQAAKPTTHIAVADTYNGRVLIFNAPFTTGMSASIVLGQAGFSQYQYVTPGPSVLFGPIGMALDASGDLYVADMSNSRVDEFQPPFASSMNATLEVGSASLYSGASPTPDFCSGGPSILCFPTDAALDSAGNLWVTDLYDGRVVEYQQPVQQAMAANLAIGQASVSDTLLTAGDCDGGSSLLPVGDSGYPASANATDLCLPNALAFDGNGNLWVSDGGNNRVLEYSPPFSTGMGATLELGYPASIGMESQFGGPMGCAYAPDTAMASNLCGPGGLAFDAQGNLWVSDSNYNRVLRFDPPFTSGMAANLVIGEPDFNDGGPTVNQPNVPASANTLHDPNGISFDSDGDLIVADTGNSRPLIFVPPFANGMSASVVIGQPDLSSNAGHGCEGDVGSPSASTLCHPSGVLAF